MAYTEEDKYKHSAYQFLIDQIRRQRGEEMGGLANLIRATESHPEAGQQALARYGINVSPGMSRRDAQLRQALQLAAFRAGSRGNRGGLPPDVIGSIGTPDFRRRLQDAAGTLDRQSIDTLLGLDLKEREFQAKGIAKPGKLSPYAQRLREMEALGLPIDENTIRDVYAPTAQGTLTGREDPRRKRPISLSALAGLTGSEPATAEESADIETAEPAPIAPADDRRSRLRSMLFGGNEY